METEAKLPTLKDRLVGVKGKKAFDHPLSLLFVEDYYKGLVAATGLECFTEVYDTVFAKYDKPTAMRLSELLEKASGFIPERKNELLYLLLIQPFYYLNYTERNLMP